MSASEAPTAMADEAPPRRRDDLACRFEQLSRARGVAARRFALHGLTQHLWLADPGTVSTALIERARAAGVDPAVLAPLTQPPPPHAVSVPFRGDEGGLVRQLLVSFDPVDGMDEAWLSPSAAIAVHQALACAERYAPPKAPGRYRLVAARPAALAGGVVVGPSLAAATVVSAVSLFTGRPVRPGVAVTGALRGDRVGEVGGIGAKVAGVKRVCTLHTLVLPHGNESEARAASGGSPLRIVPVSTLEALLAATLQAPAALTAPEQRVEQARRRFATGWSGYLWPTLAEEFARILAALPAARLDLRVEMLARLAAAARHLGDPSRSLQILDDALALTQTDLGRRAIPDAPLTYLFQQRAMTLRQLAAFGAAATAARRAVRVARRARLRGEEIKALGCAGLVARCRARLPEAIAAFERALAIQLAHDPQGAPRTRAYLLEALGDAGHEEAARNHYEHAVQELAQTAEPTARESKESWVRTAFGGTLRRMGYAAEACAVLDHPSVHRCLFEAPLPGLLARRHYGLALVADGQTERGFEVLAASPMTHGTSLWPHLRLLASLNVLHEALGRWEQGAFTPDIARRADVALDDIPREGPAAAWLAGPAARTRARLRRASPGPAPASLRLLLYRCARLG